ncbi:MAG: hypothetical protein EB033_15205, partial [Proteobacteria bacterium]|nr:hypothetical protein [Pseudomonadota bacterium]
MRAGSTGIIGLDGYLDFDPTNLQVDGVDTTGSPLETVLQKPWWDNATGHLNLSYGAFANASGAYPSGYFRVAR